MAWTTPRTWIAGELVTAGMFNVHIRDNANYLYPAPVAWTPVLTATSANPTLGNGTLTGQYCQVGTFVIFDLILTWGSTSTAGTGIWIFTFPTTSLNVGNVTIGTVQVVKLATAAYDFTATLYDLTHFYCISDPAIYLAHNSPFTWGTGDLVQVEGWFEAA